jgi:hypothetical protein
MSRWIRPLLGLGMLPLLAGSTCTSNFTEADLAKQERQQAEAARHEEKLDEELGEQGGANEEAIQQQIEESVGE